MNTPDTSSRTIPIWGILSVVLLPSTVLFTFLAAAILDRFLVRPEDVSISTLLPGTAHSVAPVMFACLAMDVIAAVMALLRRERPRWFPVLGIGTTILLIGLFLYFE